MDNFPRILGWTVENFMSIERATCSFTEDSNIMMFKGYNNSGKSAMLTALSVALTDSTPSKQNLFIKDGADYFRIVVFFDGGVTIARDKYSNGQSLYEMYMDDGKKLVYTSKSSTGALTPIKGVPDLLAQYIGFIEFGGGYLNCRTSKDKQFGVETTGSENEKAFNTILKADDLFKASQNLNANRNKLSSEINTTQSELSTTMSLIDGDDKLTSELLDALHERDAEVDVWTGRGVNLENLVGVYNEKSSIPSYPPLKTVKVDRLQAIDKLCGVREELSSIGTYPELEWVDGSKYKDLVLYHSLSEELRAIKVAPIIPVISSEHLNSLLELQRLEATLSSVGCTVEVGAIVADRLRELSAYTERVRELENLRSVIKSKEQELEGLYDQLKSVGGVVRTCPSCGCLFVDSEKHEDIG